MNTDILEISELKWTGMGEYSLEELMLKLQYFGYLMQRTDSFEKTLMLGKTEGMRTTEDEMVGWHH